MFFQKFKCRIPRFLVNRGSVKPGTDKLKAVSKATCWLFLETNLSDHWISFIRPSDSNFFAAKRQQAEWRQNFFAARSFPPGDFRTQGKTHLNTVPISANLA